MDQDTITRVMYSEAKYDKERRIFKFEISPEALRAMLGDNLYQLIAERELLQR